MRFGLTEVRRIIPILRPFPHISNEIEYPTPACAIWITAHRRCMTIPIINRFVCPIVFTVHIAIVDFRSIEMISPRKSMAVRSTSGVFQLRFGRQAEPEGAAVWFSTHPPSRERIANVRAQIAKLPAKRGLRKDSERFQAIKKRPGQ